MDAYDYPQSTLQKMASAAVNDKNTLNREIQELTTLKDEYFKERSKLQSTEKKLEAQEKRLEIMIMLEQKIDEHLNNIKIEEEIHRREMQMQRNELDSYLQNSRLDVNKYTKRLGVHLNINSCDCKNSTYQIQYSFFSREKSDNHFLICEWNSTTHVFRLLEMQPEPKEFNELYNSLEASNEIHQLLCWARKFFKYSIDSKKV